MTRLHFDNTEGFSELFKSKKKATTDTIVSGIEKAMQNGDRSAILFEITFAQEDRMFEISLPKSQWKHALESCLDHYHELEESDQAIDCWKLLELVKVW
tara:strand:- start:466 stop:762 length:297 start_codon:yes stop_codon:yes gene_type:complete